MSEEKKQRFSVFRALCELDGNFLPPPMSITEEAGVTLEKLSRHVLYLYCFCELIASVLFEAGITTGEQFMARMSDAQVQMLSDPKRVIHMMNNLLRLPFEPLREEDDGKKEVKEDGRPEEPGGNEGKETED